MDRGGSDRTDALDAGVRAAASAKLLGNWVLLKIL
jgi:hypothetical protein